MNARELVLAGLRGQPITRRPVVCPGGMMSFAVRQAMQTSGAWWPQAHRDAQAMAALALETQRATLFDNVAVPFCMTVEAEALGAQVNYGDPDVQPRIATEPLADVAELDRLAQTAGTQPDRRPVVLEAIRLLKLNAPGVAVVAATLGPFSLAAQVLEAGRLLRATRRQPEQVHELLARMTAFLRSFSLDMVSAGADVVMIADPGATGEILGANGHRQFAEPYLTTLMDAVRATGTPVILHVCGDARALFPALAATDVEAISLDETANLVTARAALRAHRLMGNLSALVLEEGPPEAISRMARHALECGVDILAPACGVTARTPSEHLALLPEVSAEE